MKPSKIQLSVLTTGLMLINIGADARPSCDSGFYTDILAGYASTNGNRNPIHEFNGKDNGAAIAASVGYHFARYFGIEVDFQHFPTGTNNQNFGTMAAKFILPIQSQNIDLYLKADFLSFYSENSLSESLADRYHTVIYEADDMGSKKALALSAGGTYWLDNHWGISGQLKYGIGSSDNSIGDYHIASVLFGISAHT